MSSSEAEGSDVGFYVAGALGGAAGVVVGHPFDTTKVQMQVHHGSKNTRGTIAYIKDQGLVRGFFRGMSFPLLSYAAINSVFFGVYNQAVRMLHDENLSHRPTHTTFFLAGSLGGAAQLLVACPSDVVKVVLQSQIPETRRGGHLSAGSGVARYYNGPRHCIQQLIAREGMAGLFRGLGPMAARDLPGYGIYLAVFECFNHSIMEYGLTDANGIIANIIAGGLAGSISWAAITPFDVIKTRVQADEERKYKGFYDCAIRSYREEGWRVFTRGMLVCAARGFPSAGITFLVYAQTLKLINNHNVL